MFGRIQPHKVSNAFVVKKFNSYLHSVFYLFFYYGKRKKEICAALRMNRKNIFVFIHISGSPPDWLEQI